MANVIEMVCLLHTRSHDWEADLEKRCLLLSFDYGVRPDEV